MKIQDKDVGLKELIIDNKTKSEDYYLKVIDFLKKDITKETKEKLEEMLKNDSEFNLEGYDDFRTTLSLEIAHVQDKKLDIYLNRKMSKIQRVYTSLTYAIKEYLEKNLYIDVGKIKEEYSHIPDRKFRMDIFLEKMNQYIEIDVYHSDEKKLYDDDKYGFLKEKGSNVISVSSKGSKALNNAEMIYVTKTINPGKNDKLNFIEKVLEKIFSFYIQDKSMNIPNIANKILDFSNKNIKYSVEYFLTNVEREELYRIKCLENQTRKFKDSLL